MFQWHAVRLRCLHDAELGSYYQGDGSTSHLWSKLKSLYKYSLSWMNAGLVNVLFLKAESHRPKLENITISLPDFVVPYPFTQRFACCIERP